MGSSVAGGSALLFAAQIVANAGYFVAVFILARALTVSQRGTVAFLTVTALVTARMFTMGFGDATTVFTAQRPRDRPTLITNLVLFEGLTSAVGGALVAGVLAALHDLRPGGIGVAELAVLAAAPLTAAGVDAGIQALLGLRRFRAQAVLITVVPWVYASLLVVGWSLSKLDVLWALGAWVAAHALGGSVLTAAAARLTGLGRPSWHLARECIAFGVRAWAGTLARFLNFRTDQILMGFIATEAALGIYSVAVNFSEILLYLPGAVGTAILPAIAQTHERDRPQRVLRSFRVLALVTVATGAIAAIAGPPLLPLVFGHKFEASVVPFLWLLPGALGYAASAVFSNALLAAGSPTLSSLGPSVSLVAGFVLDLALIPSYGANGAAVAASAAFLAGGLAAALVYRRTTSFAWNALLPNRADVREVRRLARRWSRSTVELPAE